jgi:hypothetical protein
MDDPGRDLAERAARAWERYVSSVRCGGTPEQRRFAAEQAFAADEKLAALEWAQRSRRNRRAAARALSGA